MKFGHIYKLCSRDPTVKEIYIGSTTNPRVRKQQHKKACNSPNRESYNFAVYQYIRANGGFDNWDLIVLESNIEYTEKHELRARERYWLEHLNATLNSCVPNRTMVEWREGNRNTRLSQMKQYRESHREALQVKNKQYREANRDTILFKMKQYYETNRETLRAKEKQYYEANREIIRIKKKERMDCVCGATHNRCDKSQHLKTKKHIQWQTLHDYILS